MGLDINAARFLLAEKARGVDFGNILTLGRQGIYMDRESYASFLHHFGTTAQTDGYADDFFLGLGANKMTAIDASGYEKADIIHDINQPVSPDLHSSFDTVIDGGTLEHVFNFPAAIANCMRMVKPGGQLILLTPWHNFAGHGFYQFTPELFYSTLSAENGYQIERMLIVAEDSWFSVKDPREIRQRVEIRTNDEILLHITARRISDTGIFSNWPQQSDYSTAWQNGSYGDGDKEPESTLKERVTRAIPPIRMLQTKWRNLKSQRALSPYRNSGLTRLCPSDQLPAQH